MEQSNGLAAQVQYKDFFAEAEYLHSDGKIGEKEYIWFVFPGNAANLRMEYKHNGNRGCHYARLDLGWDGRTMDETVLEKVTEGGVSNVVNHGQNKILTQRGWNLKPEYEYVSVEDGVEVLAKAQIGVREEAASQMYPYVDWQRLMNYGADVRVKYYWGLVALTAEAGYAAGKVLEDSWTTDAQAGVQTAPFRLQDYHDWQIEYATAPRLKAGLSLRCYVWGRLLYVQADARLTHAFALKHVASPDRLATALRIGYEF